MELNPTGMLVEGAKLMEGEGKLGGGGEVSPPFG